MRTTFPLESDRTTSPTTSRKSGLGPSLRTGHSMVNRTVDLGGSCTLARKRRERLLMSSILPRPDRTTPLSVLRYFTSNRSPYRRSRRRSGSGADAAAIGGRIGEYWPRLRPRRTVVNSPTARSIFPRVELHVDCRSGLYSKQDISGCLSDYLFRMGQGGCHFFGRNGPRRRLPGSPPQKNIAARAPMPRTAFSPGGIGDPRRRAHPLQKSFNAHWNIPRISRSSVASNFLKMRSHFALSMHSRQAPHLQRL